MSVNDGGPAFPFAAWNNNGTHYHSSPGMSLRDYFAGTVLPSIYLDAMKDFAEVGFAVDWREGLAIDAYKMADAMIAARSKAFDLTDLPFGGAK